MTDKTAAHTPKTWEFEADEVSEGYHFAAYDEFGNRLTEPYVTEDQARLIAAAPEMRAALKAQEAADNSTLGYNDWQVAEEAAKARRRAAISKAEGSSQ